MTATEGPNPLRCFLAVPLDSLTRQTLKRACDALDLPRQGYRLIPEHNWHLTLHFLGSQPEAVRTRLGQLIDDLMPLPEPPGTLPLNRLGTFPSSHMGRLVVAEGIAPAGLLALHQQLAGVLEAVGVPPETRPYRAHITLARKGPGTAAPVDEQALCQPLPLTRLALLASYPQSDGSRYELLKDWSLVQF